MIPLCERTYRVRSQSACIPSIHQRPPTYKKWNEDTMKMAYEAVRDRGLTVSRAAECYGIPYPTLSDRIAGRVQFGTHSGPSRYLSD